MQIFNKRAGLTFNEAAGSMAMPT